MYQHHFKIAFRQMQKSKLYTAIKIGGFAIGIAACLLIALFIQDELSYDQHYLDGDRIFRVLSSDLEDGQRDNWPSFPAPLAQVLRDNFPEIVKVGRLVPYDFYNAGANQIRRSDQMVNQHEEGFAYMDQELLDLLEIPMIYGKADQALSQPKSLVISRSKSIEYFGVEDPVGKQFVLNEETKTPYTIVQLWKISLPIRTYNLISCSPFLKKNSGQGSNLHGWLGIMTLMSKSGLVWLSLK